MIGHEENDPIMGGDEEEGAACVVQGGHLAAGVHGALAEEELHGRVEDRAVVVLRGAVAVLRGAVAGDGGGDLVVEDQASSP